METCEKLYYEEDNDNKCIDECPHWWFKNRDGFCKEEKWRWTTAIVVPSVIGGLLFIYLLGSMVAVCV